MVEFIRLVRGAVYVWKMMKTIVSSLDESDSVFFFGKMIIINGRREY